MNKIKREALFATLQKLNSSPRSELHYRNNFELLIAVMLSAQATDISVNKVTKILFSLANCPQSMINIGIDELIQYIRSIGLYRVKAKHIIASCEILLRQYNGEVPNTRQALEGLPGVGRKTANVILNTAFGHKTIAVDTHIFRVANRTGLAPGKNALEVENNLLKMVPKKYLTHAHHWLVLHGRYICKARRPECWRCPIANFCDFSK